MRELPAIEVFSRSDARRCAWTDPALSRAACSGRVSRLRRDQFTAHQPDARLAAIAAVRGCSGSVVSIRSAVLLHGLPLLEPPPVRPDLTVEPRGTGDVAGALLHRATLRPEDVVVVDGVPVTSVARTLVDLARTVSLPVSVVAADAALQRGLTNPLDVAETAAACGGWPGIKRARRALAAVDGRSESPLESISRLAIVRLGLPQPQLQALILGPGGYPLGRTDFYWDAEGVVGEADGRGKYDRREVLTLEKDRQERIEDAGVEVTRWGWRDAQRPVLLKAKIERARERGRRRDRAGFPRTWSVQQCPPLTIPRC